MRKLILSFRSSLPTSNSVILGPPLSFWAWRFTEIAPIAPFHSPRLSSLPTSFRIMAYRTASLCPLLSTPDVAFPPPCAPRLKQKPWRCANIPISLLLGPWCILHSPQGLTSPMLPESLPDSTLILASLTGKLWSMFCAIWRAQKAQYLKGPWVRDNQGDCKGANKTKGKFCSSAAIINMTKQELV